MVRDSTESKFWSVIFLYIKCILNGRLFFGILNLGPLSFCILNYLELISENSGVMYASSPNPTHISRNRYS